MQMYIWEYVCMCVCVCVYIYIYIYIYIYMYMHIYLCQRGVGHFVAFFAGEAWTEDSREMANTSPPGA